MSKLVRKTLLQFGSTVNAASEIGQYGSQASPIYSNDIDVLQAGTAWPRGWAGETVATNRPFLEDFNAIDFVYGYFLCYLLQMGLAEYDAGTTYYVNSRVQYSGVSYISLQDTNLANTPGSAVSTFWQALGDVKGADIASASSIALGSDGTIFKITGTVTINTITNPNSIRKVILYFGGILSVTSSGNIILNNGNFTTAANSMLTLIWNGSSWIEASRSPVPANSGLGSPVSKAAGTIYQAATDGFLVGNAYNPTPQGCGFYILTDASATPSTIIQRGQTLWVSGAPIMRLPFNCPIKKNDYFQIIGLDLNGSTNNSMIEECNFISLGS